MLLIAMVKRLPNTDKTLDKSQIEKLRKVDADLTSSLSEEEFEKAVENLQEIAQLAFEVYWHRKYGSKNPIGVFPPQEVEG